MYEVHNGSLTFFEGSLFVPGFVRFLVKVLQGFHVGTWTLPPIPDLWFALISESHSPKS